MPELPEKPAYFSKKLCELTRRMRDAVLKARLLKSQFSNVSRHTAADTIYELDTHVEPVLEEFCRDWSREYPLILVAEGIEGPGGVEGRAAFPNAAAEKDAAFIVIVDPIDGTRGLMYDKRSAWSLAGVAMNRGAATRLSDIFAAAQAEVPTSKQSVSDVLWAHKGGGAFAWRDDLPTGKSEPFSLRPSAAKDLAHGFASVASFFPGTKKHAAKLMEKIVTSTLGPLDVTRPMVFDDQYICTGGQFYELMIGHDRFIADLRPAFYRMAGHPTGLCVHPYDLATMLIAQEAGVRITDEKGEAVDGPLDVETPLSWMGFANAALQRAITPIVKEFLASGR